MSIYKDLTHQFPPKKELPNNKTAKLSARMRAILSTIWTLSDLEKSYLDKHFMLIRSPADLIKNHSDGQGVVVGDYHDYIVNNGVKYKVVYNCLNWEQFEVSPSVQASFRYQQAGNFAVVIIKPSGLAPDTCDY